MDFFFLFQNSLLSLLFQLLAQKTGNGLFVDNLYQFASLVVMVRSGNLLMTRVYFSGFMIMDERVQLFGKSG